MPIFSGLGGHSYLERWSTVPPAQYDIELARLDAEDPALAARLREARAAWLTTAAGQQAQLGWQATDVTQQMMTGGMGLTPEAQARMEQQYALLSAEIRQRTQGAQQGIESDLLRRGMLRSSLYGQERAALSQGMVQSLGQARIGAEQQAYGQQMGQIGMGLGAYQSAQELKLARQQQRADERQQQIQNAVNIGQLAGGLA